MNKLLNNLKSIESINKNPARVVIQRKQIPLPSLQKVRIYKK